MTTAVAPDHLWALWRRLKRLFPMWGMAWSSVASPGAFGMVGNDFVSGLRRNRNSAQVAALLADEPRSVVDALSDLAELNARRQDQVFRAIFILYVTVPFAVAAAWSDVAPDSLKAYAGSDVDFLIRALALIGVCVALYWMGAWRAKQMVSVLALIRIERGFGLHAASPAPES